MPMHALFDIAPSFPEGFTYHPGFLSEAEEQLLLTRIGKMELNPFRFQGYEAKRRVASFGKDWSFEEKSLKEGRQIPETFLPLVEKVAVHLSLPTTAIAELLVTEYPEGSVINWHRDAPPFDLIAGISLGADCTFRLRPFAKKEQSRKNTVSLVVQRRSLYVMRGKARTDFQHSIAPLSRLRYSITLRTLKA